MSTVYEVFIPGRLPGLNEVIDANRRNRYKGATLKKRATETVCVALRGNFVPLDDGPYDFVLTWVEPNRKRDPDNIASAVKFVLDGMIMRGILTNDGWSQVRSITHRFNGGGERGVVVEVTR